MTIRLTDKEARNIALPAKGNQVTYDTELKGFGIRTTAAGAKAFVLNYRADGRERRITIGSFPDWHVAAAREQAKSLKRRIDSGEDPMADRHAAREAPTVAVLADRYLAEHAPRKRERSAKEDASLLRQLIVPKLGKLRVAAVRRSEIEAFHREMSKATPVRANRALSLLTKMFNLAIGWDIRADNPCKGIQRNQEDKRDRYLTPAELERLMAALSQHPNRIQRQRHPIASADRRQTRRSAGRDLGPIRPDRGNLGEARRANQAEEAASRAIIGARPATAGRNAGEGRRTGAVPWPAWQRAAD